MTNTKLTDERPDDEGLELLITIRREIAERHASEGRMAQCAVHTLNLNALLELQERRKADSENLVKDRQRVIDGLCSVGETVWGIEEYMKKWDARYLPKTSSPAQLQGSQPVSNRDELREQVRREHAEWSDKTFGDVGPVGPLKHLSKEALEASADPSDPLEWADMQFLLWDSQRRMGISDEFITRAMIEKLAINKARLWPEPKDGEPRMHIKEQPVPVMVAECAICGKSCTNANHPVKAVAIESPLSDSESAELHDFRRTACTHGFPPGAHTQGVIGCVECSGRLVMIWEQSNGGDCES